MALIDGHTLSVKPANLEVAPTAQSPSRGEDDAQSDDPVPPDVKDDISMLTLGNVSTAHTPAKFEDEAQPDDSSTPVDNVGATVGKGSSSAKRERCQ